MKSPTKKLFTRIRNISLAVLIISTILLLLCLFGGRLSPDFESITSSLVNSETVYIMIALFCLIPISLIILTATAIRSSLPILQEYMPSASEMRRRKQKTIRFPSLVRIDEKQELLKQQAPAQAEAVPMTQEDLINKVSGQQAGSDPVPSAKQLNNICKNFREFASNRLGLYYDIADIRRFIAGMGISKLMILRGISGTGKTSLAYAAGEFFGNPSTIVPIQPMWKERSDIIGYFNEFTKRFNETTMLCKLYEAGGSDRIYITVLDEVNISRIEYYFAEFLSLLEIPDPKKRELLVVSDSWASDPQRLKDGKLLLPENMWFIGTANNDDSTFAISDKVYDRAAVIDLEQKSQPFNTSHVAPVKITYADLCQQFAQAKLTHALSDESREKLLRLDQYLTEVFRISFGNRILRQIEEYVPIMIACGGWESGALDDIFARKILRKLEQVSPSLIKSEMPGLCSLLDEMFGDEALPQSKAYLDRLLKGC